MIDCRFKILTFVIKVELVDQNVDAGDVVKTPRADLHVVLPARNILYLN